MKGHRRSRTTTPSAPALEDSVDVVLREWAGHGLALDFSPVGVVTRLARVRGHLEAGLQPVFDAHDLTSADFAVVVTLRRAGPPHRLTQAALMAQLGLTSGTVSVRLTRLVAKGVVTRVPSPSDGRGAVVTLTDEGVELFDAVAPAHLHNEDVLLSALTGPERDQLTDLLRRLLVGFEHERFPSRLGLVLAPAHAARRMRTAVGLSDTPGLLVLDVVAGGSARSAGVLPGDLLVALDGRELRSGLDLAADVADGTGCEIDLLRGTRRLHVTLSPGA